MPKSFVPCAIACSASPTVARWKYTVAGRTFRRADILQVQQLIDLYESRVASVGNPSLGGGGVLVTRNDGFGPFDRL